MQKIDKHQRLKFLVLLVIPVLLFLITSAFKEYQGPYYINQQHDPSYVYLINSLNLSQLSGYEITHIDHPGTPVQVIGAVVIRLCYTLDGKEDTLAGDVLMNPELYLSEIAYVFLILNCIGLFILGIVTYRIYSDVSAALLLQLTPFTSLSILSMLTYVRPENFLVFVVCIFISALLLFINNPKVSNKTNFLYAIIFGIIIGLGIASKILFFPLALIPLVLIKGIKNKVIFLLVILLSFFLFVLPAISFKNINSFTEWVYKLFIYNKKYGRGEPTIIDIGSYLYNIKRILTGEWFFDLSYLFVFLSLILSLIKKSGSIFTRFKNMYSGDIKFKLALGIFLTMTLQLIIVAKHYGENYMFPALTLSAFAIFISFLVLSGTFADKLTARRLNVFYIIIIITVTFYSLGSFYYYSSRLKIITEESYKLINFVEENSDNAITATTHRVPDAGFALFVGTSYGGSQGKKYKSILSLKFSSGFYFNSDGCFAFSDDSTLVERSFKSADRILLLISDDDYLQQFSKLFEREYGLTNAVFEKLFSNKNGEMVYEVKFR